MISSLGNHYLYRHVRLDKKEPFYIGIGTKKKGNNLGTIYSRAFTKYKRSSFWKNITSKTDYEVEILLESDDYEFIKQKEKEFVALYKRKDCCQGTLVNLTYGGDGFLGVHTQEAKDKMIKSKALKRQLMIKEIEISVIEYYNCGKTISYISKNVGRNKEIISEILNSHGLIKDASDYKRTDFYVYNFDSGEVVHHNLKYNELANLLNISETTIRNHCYRNKNIKDCGYLILYNNISIESAKEDYKNRVLNKDKK